MQPTLYASYRDADQAERVVGALLEAGVAPEDISLVVHSNGNGGMPPTELAATDEPLAMVDAGQSGVPMIGEDDRETFGSYLREAPGPGIDTFGDLASADTIDQADNSQELAEDMNYPASGASYSSNEHQDIAEAANNRFFNTTKPGPEGLGSALRSQVDVSPDEDSLSALTVPGIGIVLGGGSLATNVIGAGRAAEAGGNPAASLAEYLMDESVERDQAINLSIDFGAGGAILAISAPPGTAIGMDQIEQAVDNSGANNISWVGA